MDAQILLAAVKPFGCKGLVIKDVTDPATWTLDGVTDVDRPQAVAALSAILAKPVPIVVDIDALARQVAKLQTQVDALVVRVGPSLG